ncbi:MAG: glycosyltransferase, partial [Pseudomonadota bacterium]
LAPPSKPAKAEHADEIIADHYDTVLVHSDPSATPLELSWPVSDRLEPSLRYTGYVAPPYARPDPDGPGQGEIIVSAGGGAVGTPIFHAALAAAEATPEMRWRLLVGGNRAMDRISALASKGFPPNAIIEPARPDFRALLGRAAASVSMCGYNTAIDILQAGTPAAFVPFDDGQEVEQGLRARALAALPAVRVVRTSELTAHAIASAVRSVAREGPRETGDFAFDGAARSVSILQELLEKRA